MTEVEDIKTLEPGVLVRRCYDSCQSVLGIWESASTSLVGTELPRHAIEAVTRWINTSERRAFDRLAAEIFTMLSSEATTLDSRARDAASSVGHFLLVMHQLCELDMPRFRQSAVDCLQAAERAAST
jgi:hypothetical protein